MRATASIAVIALIAAGCVGVEAPPTRFAGIASASPEECGVIKTALAAVLNEEPYFSKPQPPPPISYIAVSPYLAADVFGENPYEALKETPPVNLAHCIGPSLAGPRGRIMGFDYPEQLRNDRIVDAHGWVSRPMIEGDRATVLLSRGQCYRTSTISLARTEAGWSPMSIAHAKDDIVWSGRHPCDPWP